MILLSNQQFAYLHCEVTVAVLEQSFERNGVCVCLIDQLVRHLLQCSRERHLQGIAAGSRVSQLAVKVPEGPVRAQLHQH